MNAFTIKSLFKFLICLLWLSGSVAFAADANDMKAGESFDIDSKVMAEKRHILVYLPRDYATSRQHYPVLYLTDGDAHIMHTGGTLNFLAQNNSVPEMIVVGVTNTDRTRDLTPTTSTDPGLKSAGGADRYLKFFEEELIPAINQRYRSTPYKVFAGHSLGGLFAIHTYLTHPNAFDAYIAVSPSLWWDDGLMVKRANAAFTDHKAQGVLFMSLGDEGKRMREPFEAFKAILDKNAGPGLLFASQIFDDENHGSVVLRSHYYGLKSVFFDWPMPRDASFQQLLDHFAILSKRMKYTITAPELLVNNFAYSLMGQKKLDEAIEVMRWNTRTYPASANTYDSLCEALSNAGKMQEAKQQCEKAVSVGQTSNDPKLAEFKDNLSKLNASIQASRH